MLLIDPEAMLAAIPALPHEDADERRKGFAAMRQILPVGGEIVGAAAERLARLFGLDEPEKTPLPFRRAEDESRAKASTDPSGRLSCSPPRKAKSAPLPPSVRSPARRNRNTNA
jgi:hypothetical protein